MVEDTEIARAERRIRQDAELLTAYDRGLRFNGRTPLELVAVEFGPTPPKPKSRALTMLSRGVYRDPFPPEGQVAFVIVDSYGVRRRRVEMPEAEATEKVTRQMWRWLDKHDAILQVI